MRRATSCCVILEVKKYLAGLPRNILYMALAYFFGVFSSMAVIPLFINGPEFKTAWGNVLGSFFGLTSAAIILVIQRQLQLHDKKKDKHEAKMNFYNRFRSVLIVKFELVTLMNKHITEALAQG